MDANDWQQNPLPEDLSAGALAHRLRHSCAHIMAEAVLTLFPDARYATGPATTTGFFYDFELPRALTPDDLTQIERRMKKIAKRGSRFYTAEVSKDEARALFTERGQTFKLDIIERIPGETVTLYKQNEFIDLCAGPHVDTTRRLRALKLLNVAGAYWRGDSDGPMLQRIYGTVFPDKEKLEAYLTFREEVKKRDHRTLGPQLDLFWFHPASPGSAFWAPRGVTVRQQLEKWWRQTHKDYGYIEIMNPSMYRAELFKTSGHWEHYRDDMFVLEDEHQNHFCLKPMNCPDTMLFFKTKKRSYRELPLRVAEAGLLHRNELSGALSGMTRLRTFTQDDSHVFVTEDQIGSEMASILDIVEKTYSLFGLDYQLVLSTRPEKAMGDPALWDRAEGELREVIEATGRPWKIDQGGGAFYGPKIDIYIKDSLGRRWQCATLQLDFQLPIRFDLTYVASDNTRQRPIVIHRAVFGSFERFFAIVLEHFAGALPTWLSPVQVQLLSIKDSVAPYCHEVAALLEEAGIRVHVDDRSETIGKKIREAELAKTPFMCVVGEREAEQRKLAIRTYRDGKQPALSPEELRDQVLARIEARTLDIDVPELAQWQDVFEADEDALPEY